MTSFKKPNPKQSFPKLEQQVIKYWNENHIFKKSVNKKAPKGDYVFYDGPPFATGLPHYGHILAGTIKDVVPRYFTMRGYRVERRWGWDCHGLPIENIIENELKLDDKKALEAYGIGRFNESCRSTVLRYAKEWGKVVERMGRWVEFENSYRTMDQSYMESIWWVMKSLWDKKLVYKGHKSMHICPRCETPLSNFEVGLGYKDITDISATVKLVLDEDPTTSVLAWTTTPWTLPGNVIAAVGKNIDYVKAEVEDGFVILAKERIDAYFPDEKPKIVARMKGKDLVGKKYKPMYDFYNVANHPKTFQFYEGDFVTTADGSGVVHIAPGFGEDDMLLCQKVGTPFVQHVGMDGKFKAEVKMFAGLDAKKSDRMVADELATRNLLFREQKYKHSYPHCWRCDTALLNYATESWFVNVTRLKARMLKNNRKINWKPDHLKEGRFGKWLENAKDWAISRNRYWGAPLPIWTNEKGDYTECLGSIDDLRERTDSLITKITFLRHGESVGNIKGMRQAKPPGTALTEKGKKQAEKAARELKKSSAIDLIITSPLKRCKQTASIIGKALGVDVKEENTVREINFGKVEGKMESETEAYLAGRRSMTDKVRYSAKIGGTGESHEACGERMYEYVQKVISKYPGKHILIISHSDTIRWCEKEIYNRTPEAIYMAGHLPYAQARPHYFMTKTKKPVDLHKHHVDNITYKAPNGKGTMRRIPEVLDCWFESGSMPYAQKHYPFENKDWFEENFPAQFIAEGLDQTRGWFYTLTVLATALFDQPAFQNVIVNGIVLAEDGQKMSKSKKNYPDPQIIFADFGADAMRFYLMNSQVVRGDDFRFSQKGVEEIVRNVILPFWNSYSFFITYANIDNWTPKKVTSYKLQVTSFGNKLDQWVISELNRVVADTTAYMEKYELLKATETLLAFLDGLTNWYIRRSRRRFWKSENDGDKNQAYETLYRVLVTLCKLFAPFMPFVTEEMYRNLTGEESVHLSNWPTSDAKLINKKLNQEIAYTRTIVALGHAARAKSRIKVRQPLLKIELALPEKINPAIIKEQLDVIKEELNVKDVTWIKDLENTVQVVARPNAKLLGPKYGADVQKIIIAAKEGKFKKLEDGRVQVLDFELKPEEFEIAYLGKEGQNVESNEGVVVILDTNVTPELKLEGIARDIVRTIQDLRKQADLNVSDRIVVGIKTSDVEVKDAIEKFTDYIQKETLAEGIASVSHSAQLSSTITVESAEVEISIKKI
jgi:isoleucyl-tRNA synthetase